MKKKIIVIILVLIILIIPFFIFNDTEATEKKKVIKENNAIVKNSYNVNSDNINNYIKEEIVEEEKEIIVVEELEEVSKDNKFKYLTNKFDNINEDIKEEEKEEERIKYICIKEEKNINFKVENNKTYYYENDNKVKGLKLIDGVRYYFDFDTGELIKENVKSVIDISSWQGDVDFEKVKNLSKKEIISIIRSLKI